MKSGLCVGIKFRNAINVPQPSKRTSQPLRAETSSNLVTPKLTATPAVTEPIGNPSAIELSQVSECFAKMLRLKQEGNALEGNRPQAGERSTTQGEHRIQSSAERTSSRRFAEMMQLSRGGDRTQAAQLARQLKAELGAEKYAALQRDYLASKQGSALEGNRTKQGTKDQDIQGTIGDQSDLQHGEGLLSPGHTDFMLPNDQFSINAQNRELIEGYYDVIAHGNPRRIRIDTQEPKFGIDHRTLARILRNRQDYDGECIRMLSCSTGALPDGFAQNLSNKVNKKVLTPSDIIWAGEKGEFAISEMKTVIDPLTGEQSTRPKYPYTGKWNNFEPGGNIKLKQITRKLLVNFNRIRLCFQINYLKSGRTSGSDFAATRRNI